MFEIAKKEFIVTETNITFETIYNKPYFPVNIPDIKKANVLLIPNENLRSDIGITFPETTNDFLEFLQDKSDDNFKPDIAVSDNDFKKYIMHSDVIQIATIICTSIILPFLINIISSYLYDLLKRSLKQDKELNVELLLYVQNGQDKSSKLHYIGPVSELKDTLNSVAFSSLGESFKLTQEGKNIEVKQKITSNNNSALPITEVDNSDGRSRH